MAKRIRHDYVPKALLKAWADDKGAAKWSNPFSQRYGNVSLLSTPYWSWLESPSPELERIISLYDSFLPAQLEKLRHGDFGDFYEEHDCLRFNLLFLWERSEIYFSYNKSSLDVSTIYDYAEKADGKTFLTRLKHAFNLFRPQFLTRIIQSVWADEAQLLRFEPVILKAPEGSSFIIGSSPLNIFNPFFSGREVSYPDGPEYEKRGACLSLPLSPSLCLLLYDMNVYRVRNARKAFIFVTSHDVDVLNMIQIYSGGDNEGFVYSGDKARIVDTILRFGGVGVRNKPGYFDSYPFDTTLECAPIRADEEDRIEEYRKNPVDSFVSDYKEYNKGYLERVKADETSYERENHLRYVHTYNLLFENEISE